MAHPVELYQVISNSYIKKRTLLFSMVTYQVLLSASGMATPGEPLPGYSAERRAVLQRQPRAERSVTDGGPGIVHTFLSPLTAYTDDGAQTYERRSSVQLHSSVGTWNLLEAGKPTSFLLSIWFLKTIFVYLWRRLRFDAASCDVTISWNTEII